MKTKLLKFRATDHHKTHTHPSGLIFFDGDEIEVDTEIADQLLRDFPKNFTDVRAEAKKVVERGKKKKGSVEVAPDKSVDESKTKTK